MLDRSFPGPRRWPPFLHMASAMEDYFPVDESEIDYDSDPSLLYGAQDEPYIGFHEDSSGI